MRLTFDKVKIGELFQWWSPLVADFLPEVYRKLPDGRATLVDNGNPFTTSFKPEDRVQLV